MAMRHKQRYNMTNMSDINVADGRACPTPATEALKVFMTQHLPKCGDSSASHPPATENVNGCSSSTLPSSHHEPLDLSNLCREAVRVEQNVSGSSTDDDVFPSIEWNSDDDADADADETAHKSDENRPFWILQRRSRRQREFREENNSSASSSESSSSSYYDGLDDARLFSTIRKRRSGDALLPSCDLHRCKRKMCLPGCLGQGGNACLSPIASALTNDKTNQLPRRQQSLSVGSSLDAVATTTTSSSTTAADAAFLAATLRTMVSEEYCILTTAPSWGQFVTSDSTPSSPSHIRKSPSRARGQNLKKAGSCGVITLRNKNNSFCRPVATT